jgi:NAD(P)-dependent dehydrogenase (short-subunit alcohol dehydrogenase family)
MERLRIGPLRFREAPFLELGQTEWQELVDALERATFELQAFARGCTGPGSAVVVSSAAAARAIEGCTLDAVAGAFLTTVAQVAAVELRPQGITVNTLVPAYPPDESTLSAVAQLLASDAAAGVTGAVIAADGGFSVTKEPGARPPARTED